ncbi:MAG: tol-pal system protein YbgF [Azoarcus sp.]|jgi:tol-pal system protein YbgF|nr:tol-pal system protein YbgF [Azoarcus sp.]
MRRLLLLAACAAFFQATPARAGLFDDDEARQQIDRLKQELQGRVEIVTNGQLELSSQNEELRAEIARLRGQIEVLLNEVESLKNRQRDFYVDLDNRLRRFESTGGAPAEATAAPPAAASGDYENALFMLKEGRPAEALAELETFIGNNPDSANLPAAHFWAGTAALQTKDVAAATKHFNLVLGRWPNDPTAPDAMLGVANAQIAMGDQRNARQTLRSLIGRYPSSTAAKTAKQHLGR